MAVILYSFWQKPILNIVGGIYSLKLYTPEVEKQKVYANALQISCLQKWCPFYFPKQQVQEIN